MKKDNFSPTENIIKIAKQGGMYILVDDENRENEGDLVFCSSDVSSNKINFIGELNLKDLKLIIELLPQRFK